MTNHAVLLVYVALHPDSTVRTIALDVGITERATLAIMRDLDLEGIVDRRRTGRRNEYSVNFGRLSMLRRGGTSSPLTPRLFVDVVIKTLFEIASRAGMVVQHAPPTVVEDSESQARVGSWGFFTNHMLILLAIARDGSQTVRELSGAAMVTERAAVAILNQMEAEGIIQRRREGRRNSYTIDYDGFLMFRGWQFETWRIPPELVDVAITGIRMLASRSGA
ncbi:MAG: winged helix-turn-helix transcriptional regulator [Chloroflexi bacterium]|nr:winged helix-turn-helix transcriptional regulator [Chloroflexota bacterium]